MTEPEPGPGPPDARGAATGRTTAAPGRVGAIAGRTATAGASAAGRFGAHGAAGRLRARFRGGDRLARATAATGLRRVHPPWSAARRAPHWPAHARHRSWGPSSSEGRPAGASPRASGLDESRGPSRFRQGLWFAAHPAQRALSAVRQRLSGRSARDEARRPDHLRWLRRRFGRRTRRRVFVVVVVIAGMMACSAVPMVATGQDSAASGGAGAFGDAATVAARTGIPEDALTAYWSAAQALDVDWTILAGIGSLECNHGRSRLPGCPPGTVNFCGARGPMQFLGNTWRRGTDAVRTGQCPGSGAFTGNPVGPPIPNGEEHQGYATDGDGDGIADPWVWRDATHAAARYLLRNHYREDVRQAVFAYNRSTAYVDKVLARADQYRAAAGATEAASSGQAGEIAAVACPSGGSITVAASLAPALRQLLDAASAAGVRLCGGGFRTPEQQIERRRANCGTTHYDIYEKPASECSPPTAPPGQSMHEKGLAVDFTCNGPNIIPNRSSPCFGWLQANAAAYGLRNLPSEPWHWSTNGA